MWEVSFYTKCRGFARVDREPLPELRIKGLFDNIDHELLMKAVRKHTDCPWVILYIERWLKAPFQMKDGSQRVRTSGTPQGDVISPVLANLFMHYTFDIWMTKEHSQKPVGKIRG
ncbi:reverse transcriptase domain-containing protein [Paenibacillus rhizoplanae]